MMNDPEQVSNLVTMGSYDPDSAGKIVSQVTERIETAKSLLVTAFFANMGIVFLFERSGWAAVASLIATVAAIMVLNKIADASGRARTAIELSLGLATSAISERLDLLDRANKNKTTLHGKVSTNATRCVDADGSHFLQFDIAVDNVDYDHVIGVTYQCGELLADILEAKFRTGTHISVDGYFVGRIQGDNPERRLRIAYFVSNWQILQD